jgi:hypothetical protein
VKAKLKKIVVSLVIVNVLAIVCLNLLTRYNDYKRRQFIEEQNTMLRERKPASATDWSREPRKLVVLAYPKLNKKPVEPKQSLFKFDKVVEQVHVKIKESQSSIEDFLESDDFHKIKQQTNKHIETLSDLKAFLLSQVDLDTQHFYLKSSK